MPILSTLADRQAAVTRAADKVFGERARIIPRLKSGASDPARERVVVTAVFRSMAEKDRDSSGGSRDTWGLRLEAGESALYIDAAAYPDLKIGSSDEVCLIDRPGTPYFEVASVDQRSSPRMIVGLREGAGARRS